MPIVECGFPHVAPAVSPANALAYQGPTVLVHVGFDPSAFGNVAPAAGLPAIPPAQDVAALIDTGALESCIDEQLAQQLQLPLVDTVTVSGVGGPVTLSVYLATITIPGFARQHGRFSGVHLAAGGQPHRALIGRTLLRNSLLIYDGLSGSVKLAR